ncbi:MAG: Snf7 family protein [Candidatus Thorarchaeota archaeon]|nr:Snf7 family protein [Candidatus Thorarchaeota archaeon]
MKSVKKAFTWGRKRPDAAEVSSQLRVLAKQLERERNRLEKEERENKARAVKARKEGHIEAYRMYAAEMVRFRRYALGVDRSRLQMLKILAHLTRAQTTARATMALDQVASILGIIGTSTDATKVVENLDEITRRLEEFEIESGITDEAFDMASGSQVSSEDLSAAMAEIDAAAGMGEAAPVAARPVSEAEELEEAIKSLERELGV